MIAGKQLQELPSLESLPDMMKRRVLKALTSLAEVAWCAESHGGPRAVTLFAPRVGDLLRTGATFWDCQWLLMAGCIRVLKSDCHTCRGKNGFHRPSRRLDEQTLVVLTEAGDAELRRLSLSPAFPIEVTKQNGDESHHSETSLIRYDSENRELFVGHTLVLPVRPIARNLDTLLKGFEEKRWEHRIACPFKGLENGKRAQTVRDAVHGLNTMQRPQLLLFHSDRKGASIRYEFLSDADLDGEDSSFRIRRPR